MVIFNKFPLVGTELKHISNAVENSTKISGDGDYSKKCERWFENSTKVGKSLMMPSCTHALELAAILIGIKEGDEVIMPSYTFVSTANAFVLRGAKIVFVDIRPDTMNLDENKIEEAITEKTKAIVPVHYAGVGCEMDKIIAIADKYHLYVIEDSAQGMMAQYKDKSLGAIGHLGTYSFHETKNYTSGGEGGLLLINDPELVERAEVIREKGTNRSKFFRGMVDKYTWIDIGSSYLPSEIQAAYLWAQIESSDVINENRLATWYEYYEAFKKLKESGVVELPHIPGSCKHNAHMFYLKLKDLKQRTHFIDFMREKGVSCVFHYVPLHKSPAGLRYGRFSGADVFTSRESERLVRLPIWYGMREIDKREVIESVLVFFDQ